VAITHSQLRAFHAVASEGSFTRAAAALHVTQPTLSAQVKSLEAAYGALLFDRRGRRIEPTELGRQLLTVTRRYFSLESEAEQLLAATRGLRGGHLRVGADAPQHVMAALSTFQRAYPGVRLSLSIGNSDEVLHQLLEHRTDVAIIADLAPDPRLHARPLRRDHLIAFVERHHPWAMRGRVASAELARQRVILREIGSTTRRAFEAAMARRRLQVADVLEIGSREGVREAVAAGLGVGIVSAFEFGHDERLRALEIAGDPIETVEYVACLADRRELRLVRAFLRTGFITEGTVNTARQGRNQNDSEDSNRR
jgi:aminoethylphosphonate catabolism LysR family transcriptional regulator